MVGYLLVLCNKDCVSCNKDFHVCFLKHSTNPGNQLAGKEPDSSLKDEGASLKDLVILLWYGLGFGTGCENQSRQWVSNERVNAVRFRDAKCCNTGGARDSNDVLHDRSVDGTLPPAGPQLLPAH